MSPFLVTESRWIRTPIPLRIGLNHRITRNQYDQIKLFGDTVRVPFIWHAFSIDLHQ